MQKVLRAGVIYCYLRGLLSSTIIIVCINFSESCLQAFITTLATFSFFIQRIFLLLFFASAMTCLYEHTSV